MNTSRSAIIWQTSTSLTASSNGCAPTLIGMAKPPSPNWLASGGLLAEYIATVNEALDQENRGVAANTEPISKRIRDEIKQLRRRHLDDLSESTMAPPVSIAFMATLNAYARVRDHTRNIAEAISGEK